MPDPSPVWQDEAFAGTLFPAARPIPAKWIASDYHAITTVEEFRVEQSVCAAQRDAARAQEQSPEAQEVAWRQAHEQARLEMRRERQQERVAAGIEPEATSADYVRYCEEWVKGVAEAMLPGLQQAAQAFASLSQSLASIDFAARWQEINDAIISAAAIPAPMLSTSPLSSAMSEQEMDDIKASLANGGWFPPSGHVDALKRAVQSMDALAAPAPNRKPAPQYRERYLPGTRHARRGR